ncbi:MAG TPA: flavodoxin family protein [Candidatus Limiplasma sp.]|nr:flavodoxin family protein [Candidatus Limiplasma sp.]HRX09274.1 flavodoxin family protein [Candidatus Limiplasma sp.]
MKTLLIVSSYHHGNTLKVAHAIADCLQAEIVTPSQVQPDTLAAYDLVGFGSGIYSAKHHTQLLKLAEALHPAGGRRAFLFSTDGMPRLAMMDESRIRKKLLSDHAALRKALEAKGYTIVGDFGCAGYNTNSFLKLFGGLNKGRPNKDDIQKAMIFAEALVQ